LLVQRLVEHDDGRSSAQDPDEAGRAPRRKAPSRQRRRDSPQRVGIGPEGGVRRRNAREVGGSPPRGLEVAERAQRVDPRRCRRDGRRRRRSRSGRAGMAGGGQASHRDPPRGPGDGAHGESGALPAAAGVRRGRLRVGRLRRPRGGGLRRVVGAASEQGRGDAEEGDGGEREPGSEALHAREEITSRDARKPIRVGVRCITVRRGFRSCVAPPPASSAPPS